MKKHPAEVITEKMLKKAGFRFVRVGPRDYKILDEYFTPAYLEIKLSAHVDRAKLIVPTVYDNSPEFPELYKTFNGLEFDY